MAYQFEVDTGSTLMTNLLAYYTMDEASGTRYDVIGGYDLTDNNTVASATGKKSNGADFEKDNSEYLSRAGDDAALDLQNNFSVAGWAKPETLSSVLGYSQTIAAKDASGAGWTLRMSSVDNKLNWVKDDATSYNSTTAFTAGAWYFFAVTFDGTNIRVYINGNSPESTTAYTAHSNVTNGLQIGRSANHTTRLFDGIIDELGFWSKALTATEIGDLYNSGNGNTLTVPATTGGNFFSLF